MNVKVPVNLAQQMLAAALWRLLHSSAPSSLLQVVSSRSQPGTSECHDWGLQRLGRSVQQVLTRATLAALCCASALCLSDSVAASSPLACSPCVTAALPERVAFNQSGARKSATPAHLELRQEGGDMPLQLHQLFIQALAFSRCGQRALPRCISLALQARLLLSKQCLQAIHLPADILNNLALLLQSGSDAETQPSGPSRPLHCPQHMNA